MSLDIAAETDRELMQRVQGGETDCFAELIRRYRPALVRVASSRLKPPDSAEDAVQETFLAAYKSRHTYDARFGFRTWLWTIMLNQCRRIGQRASRVPSVTAWSSFPITEFTQAGELPSRDAGASPLQHLLAQEQSTELHAMLGQLADVQADALRLRFFGGLKFDEIAETMCCTPCTAKNRVKAGLLRLAQMLAARGDFCPVPTQASQSLQEFDSRSGELS
ncbi:MAG: RNA polymerase sigma factor [Pirellulales bacterium]